MISDLTDSDGMGWTDNDDDPDTDDPVVTSITFGSQDDFAGWLRLLLLLRRPPRPHGEPQPQTHWLRAGQVIGTGEKRHRDNCQHCRIQRRRTSRAPSSILTNFIKLVYDDDDDTEVYAGW